MDIDDALRIARLWENPTAWEAAFKPGADYRAATANAHKFAYRPPHEREADPKFAAIAAEERRWAEGHFQRAQAVGNELLALREYLCLAGPALAPLADEVPGVDFLKEPTTDLEQHAAAMRRIVNHLRRAAAKGQKAKSKVQSGPGRPSKAERNKEWLRLVEEEHITPAKIAADCKVDSSTVSKALAKARSARESQKG